MISEYAIRQNGRSEAGSYLEEFLMQTLSEPPGDEVVAADLSGADLARTDFTGADLRGVNLQSAEFDRTVLQGADLGGAQLSGTRLMAVDVSALCEATPSIRHQGPSHIDYATIILSLYSPSLHKFLQKIGLPDVFVTYMMSCALSLQTDAFNLLRSTYLIFGQPDEPFARRLYEALHRNGVITFFFPEHAVPGTKLHHVMYEGIAGHDRVVLICSKDSLNREGVLFELDQTLAREAREKKSEYLLPVLLDAYVFEGWAPPNSQHLDAVRGRVAADFRGAAQNEDKFNAGLLKLVAALRK